MLHASSAVLVESQVTENLLNDFNEMYNAKQGKSWGNSHPESGAYTFTGWLKTFMIATTYCSRTTSKV